MVDDVDDVDKKIVGNSHCDIIYTDIAQPELLRSHLSVSRAITITIISGTGAGACCHRGGVTGPLSRSRVSDNGWVQVRMVLGGQHRILFQFPQLSTFQFLFPLSSKSSAVAHTCLKQMNIYIF